MPCRVICIAGLMLCAASAVAGRPDPFTSAREKMVEESVAGEGITDLRVLEAMRITPRHEFCRPADIRRAYVDIPMPIGYGQTISPPFIVAYMTQTLEPQATDKVLEIGTGSGYQAAVLSPLVKDVYTIEIVEQLAKSAAAKFKRLDYKNIHSKAGDGYQGWKEFAPFDKIIVTCSPEKVPQPLVDQLADGGRIIIPLGERYHQSFYLLEKHDGKLAASKLVPTLFVPMTGISEDRRQIQPDASKPDLRNGSFELDEDQNGKPDDWHYCRQAKIHEDATIDGQHTILLSNTEPGELSQVLQAFAIDGRKVAGLEVSAAMRAQNIIQGPYHTQHAGIGLLFFDAAQREIGSALIPVPTEPSWTTVSRRFPVPPAARDVVVQITLAAGTGELEVDNVQITAVSH